MTTAYDPSIWEDGGAPVDALLQQIAEKLGVTIKASTVFGEPVERNGLTVIPVAKARWGFGGGGGSAARNDRGPGGSGGGGGMVMSPVGYIEVRDGRAAFRPIRDPRAYLPYVVAAVVVAMLSLRALASRKPTPFPARAGDPRL
jgi:uncharacterized spore protein YtfJ